MIRRALFLLGILFLSCNKAKRQGNETLPLSSMYLIHIEEKRGERKSMEVQANRITIKDDTFFIHLFRAWFFDREAETTGVVYADSSVYNTETGDLKAIGNVKVYLSTGDSLFTDTLLYFKSKDRIVVPCHLVIFRRGQRIEGDSLTADPEFKEVIIDGKVLGEAEGIRDSNR